MCHLFISYIIYYYCWTGDGGEAKFWEMCQQRAQQSLKFILFYFFKFFLRCASTFCFFVFFFGKFHDILGAETLSGICDTGDKVDDDRNLKGKIKKRKFIHFLF